MIPHHPNCEAPTPGAKVHAPGSQLLSSHTSLTNSTYDRKKGGFVLSVGWTKPPFVLPQSPLSTVLVHNRMWWYIKICDCVPGIIGAEADAITGAEASASSASEQIVGLETWIYSHHTVHSTFTSTYAQRKISAAGKKKEKKDSSVRVKRRI
ncbi:hypothetical protein C8R44DRAFT_746081 [Mycena epipterygia]|nr:hypothetical protein C8R44DRAFT_746081 [Mycena epipterygia]